MQVDGTRHQVRCVPMRATLEVTPAGRTPDAVYTHSVGSTSGLAPSRVEAGDSRRAGSDVCRPNRIREQVGNDGVRARRESGHGHSLTRASDASEFTGHEDGASSRMRDQGLGRVWAVSGPWRATQRREGR